MPIPAEALLTLHDRRPIETASIQLQEALRMCERNGSHLVSVPLSVDEIRAVLKMMGMHA
jgi:hypothetical protein